MFSNQTDAMIGRTQKFICDVDRSFAKRFSDARTGNFLTVILQVRANMKLNPVPSTQFFQCMYISGATASEAVIFPDIYGDKRRKALQQMIEKGFGRQGGECFVKRLNANRIASRFSKQVTAVVNRINELRRI